MKIEDVTNYLERRKGFMRQVMFLILFTVIIVFAVFNLSVCFDVLQQALGILSPFLMGIVFAYIVNILVTLFEQKVFARLNEKNNRLWNKIRRGVCILIAFLIIFGLLVLIMFLIIPELGNSLMILKDSFPRYIERAVETAENFLADNPAIGKYLGELNFNLESLEWDKILKSATAFIGGSGKTLLSVTVGFTSGIVNVVLGLVFSVYLLASKEKLILNLKRVVFAFLPKRRAERLVSVGALANQIFKGYVGGQFTEALILGTLCFIGMSILKIPYALLVSVIIAITSLIPVFGAYIGGIIGGLIIFLVNPLSCLWFAVYIILLQNFEGNVIYPRVVGNSVGLPGIWVMSSIVICGNLFGFVGMLIGVPVTSLVYALFKESTARRLKEREITKSDIERASRSEILADEVPVETQQVQKNEDLKKPAQKPKK